MYLTFIDVYVLLADALIAGCLLCQDMSPNVQTVTIPLHATCYTPSVHLILATPSPQVLPHVGTHSLTMVRYHGSLLLTTLPAKVSTTPSPLQTSSYRYGSYIYRLLIASPHIPTLEQLGYYCITPELAGHYIQTFHQGSSYLYYKYIISLHGCYSESFSEHSHMDETNNESYTEIISSNPSVPTNTRVKLFISMFQNYIEQNRSALLCYANFLRYNFCMKLTGTETPNSIFDPPVRPPILPFIYIVTIEGF